MAGRNTLGGRGRLLLAGIRHALVQTRAPGEDRAHPGPDRPAASDSPTPDGEGARTRPRRRRSIFGASAAALALAACIALSGASAAPGLTFTVNDTADVVDASVGDGQCRTSANRCTLRAAIQEANAHAGADLIYIEGGTYPIAIAPVLETAPNAGDFEILDPVTIEAAPGFLDPVVIDGGNPLPSAPLIARGLDRIFEIHPGAGDVTLRNVTLQNGFSPEEGGAIQNWSLGKLTLDGVTIRDSYAEKAGGGLNQADLNDYPWVAEPPNLALLPHGRVEIKRSTFTGNGAGGGGGAINNVSGGTITISDESVITLNPGAIKPDPLDPEEFVLVDPSDYPINASAIANEAAWDSVGTIKISNSTVSLNASEGPGAGISSSGDSIVTIENGATITQNRTAAEGGGLYTEGGTVSVVDSEISKNQAANGGGLYSGGHVSIFGLRGRFDVKNSEISENIAENGGGIYNDGEAQLFVTDTAFTKNRSSDHGAAVSSSGRSNMTLTRVEVVENESHGEGGGVWTHSERRQTIVDSLFSLNKAGVPIIEDGVLSDDVAGGGGLYSDGGPVTVVATTFDGNEATEEGGGLSIHNLGDFVLTDSTVSNNRAHDGGGLENSAHRVTFERVTVSRNRASGEGGGIFNTSSGEFSIVDSTIRENSGAVGGGLANAPDNSIIVKRSLFLNNSARLVMTEEGEFDENAGRGGGIMSYADGQSLYENTTLSGNKAAVAGGGLFHDADGELRLMHMTIWRNSAPAGGGVGVVESDFAPSIPPKTNASVIAKNSIIGGSLKGGNCDWYIRSEGGNLETGEKNTCFLAVTAETAQSPIELGVRDRRGDPQLWAIADNGGLTMTHALQEGSLAIDSSNVPCAVVDQRGEARPQNGKCDAGAFEFVGPPPLADVEPPDTQFVLGVDGPKQDSPETMAFTFRGTDNATAANELNFECRLLEHNLAEQPDPVAPWDPVPPELRWNGCASPWSTKLFEEGLLTFEVRAIDRAGNVDPTPISVPLGDIGMLPPETIIHEKPPLQTNSRSALFSFEGISDFTPPQFIEFECRLDSRDPAMWLECTNPAMYSNLSTGLHTFEVRAWAGEGAGPDPTPARYTWRIGPDPNVPVATPLTCDEANVTLTAAADGWADQVNPLENYLFMTELNIRSAATDPGNGAPIVPQNARAFFRFNIGDDAPDCELESATLRLYAGSHTEGRTLEAVPLEDTWKESSLTWFNQPDPYPGAAAATTESGELYREWDVKAHVDSIRSGDLPNNGWVVRDQHESDTLDGGDQTFLSREMPQDPPEVTLPELELRYVPADTPDPPARDDTLVDRDDVHCGEIITESTRLTADVTGCLGEGIGIGAPDIILDLNGHTVSSGLVLELGEEDGLTPGIRNSYSNVEIMSSVPGGLITNFGYGVLLGPGATHNDVHHLTLYRNVLAGVQLFDADNGRTGNLIRDNRFDSNGETGVQLFAGSEGSTVENNYFISNGMSIHLDAARANVIRDNEVSGIILDPLLDSDAGIVLENGSRLNVLEGNDVSDTGDAGVIIHQGSHGNIVRGGVLVRNGDAGVIVGESDRIEIDDVVSHQQSDGGVVLQNSSGSSVKNSDLRYNPSGIAASNTNGLVVANNDVSHSLQAGIGLGNGIGMSVTGNTANQTGGSGISLEGAAIDANGAAVGGALIEGNTANQNAESGLSIAVGRHTIRANEAHNNAGYGIAAGELDPADPIVANIDGGGNKATGNAEAVQCLGVVCDETGSVPLAGADTTAPETTITDGPLGPTPAPLGSTGSETARFTFTGDDGPGGTPLTGMSFECRIDAPPDPVEPVEPELEPPDPNNPDVPEPPEGEGWAECVSPHTFLGLEPGTHRLEVRAIDWATNFDLTPAVYSWTIHPGVDDEGQTEFPSISPDTRISAAPGELITDEAGTRYDTTNRAASFSFAGSDNLTAGYNLAYECRVHYDEFDDSLVPAEMPSESVLPFEPCTSPKQYASLEYGGHIFEVRAIDLAGNRDTTAAWHAWWIHPPPPDITPPDTTIVSGPDPMTVLTSATFTFSGSDNQTPAGEVQFQCRLDGAMDAGEPAWTDCSSPYLVTVPNLATVTEHVLQVRAVDLAANVDDVNGTTGDELPDGVPAAYVWKVGPAPVPRTVFCGQKITQSIIVNNNLGDCIGHGLIVGADNITIDLNGKTIDGKSIGAGILNNGYDSVTIKNGQLMDFDFGVMLNNGAKSNIVQGVTAQQNQDAGVSLGQPTANENPALPTPPPPPSFMSGVDGNILRSNTIVSNASGVWVSNGAKDNVARGNLIGSTSGEAVWIERAGQNLIEGNNIAVASKDGVLLEGATDNIVKGNSISDVGTGVLIGATTSGTIGIESSGNRVEGNVISDSAGPALELDSSSDNELIDNVGTLVDSYAVELYLANDNVIRGNVVSGNKGGISLKNSTGNLIEANDAGESDSVGIVLESQSFSNVLRANTSNNNGGAGIYIGDETPAGQGTLVEGNTANSNTGIGIQATKPSHTFKGNVAFDNDSWGIHVGDPSGGRSNIDGGGNVAQGNKGPLGVDLKPQQCYNVTCLGGPGGGDQIAPNTSILEAPLHPSSESVAVFRFTGADNQGAVTFECRFQSTLESAWQPCASPKNYNNLVDGGEYMFEVRALDSSGNYDPTPETHAWTVELGDFVASIDSMPDRVTVNTSATFEFSANRDSGVTFQCVLQPAATPVNWTTAPACTSPKSYTGLVPGEYEFWVRATDEASNFDTKLYAWTVGPPPVAAEVSCGQILTQSTRLLNDLVDCGGHGLIVGAPGITIDLDGHIVDGMGLDAGILNNGHDDVTIMGGLISQFLYGVQLNPGTARNVVHSLRLEGNEEAAIALSDADQGADGNTIRDNSIVGNEIGIALYTGTRNAVIRGNTLGANGGEAGILLEFASDNLVEGNQIGMSGGAGVMMVGGGNNTVSENTIKDSGGYGVVAGQDLLASNDNLVQRNTIRGGQGGVLVGGEGNRVLNNTVAAGTGPGVSVELATNTLVKGNDFGGNAAGVAVSESTDTTIEANNASGTLGAGIAVGELSTGTIVRDNTASGNGGAGIEVSDSSILDEGAVIEDNTADANGGDGIYVEGTGHRIIGNVAQLNGGWGIYTVGATDGGGNFAAGNMEPEQCFGVVCELGVVPGAPDTWVVSGPADVDTVTAGVQSNSRNASFTYMGDDGPGGSPITELAFECRIDSTNPTAWEDCEYPAEFLNLSPGQHTLEVRAIDMMGQGLADPTPAVFTWSYVPLPFGDPPEVILDVTPPAQTFLLEAVFTFHSNEPDVTFQCRVDSNGYQPCGFEGATYMNQGAFEWAVAANEVGPHTFSVRAIDFEGNVGDPTTYTWSVLGVSVVFTDGPGFVPATGGPGGDPATGGPTASSSAEIHFEANAADAEFWCRFDSLDPMDYFPCSPPFRAGPAHVGSTAFPDPLLPGDHMLEVFAESELMGSAAELEPAVYEWEVVEAVDTMPPNTFIERAPVAEDLSSTIFEFSGIDDMTPPFLLTFECQVTDGTAPPNENDWVACTSPFNLLDVYSYADPQMLLTEHTFYVRATDMFEPEFPNPQAPDAAGNPDPTPASHTWTPVADTRAPSATISGGPADGATVGEAAEPYTFFGSDNATPVLALDFQCAAFLTAAGIATADFEPCSSPYELGGLEPGAYTVAVRALDLAGNTGPAALRAVTVAAAPLVTILTGPNGRIDPISGQPSMPFSSTENAVFTFRADQPGTTFECSLDGGEFVACNTPSGGDPSVYVHAFWVVDSGEHAFALRATNAQGIVAEEVVYEWMVELGPDVTAPNTTITSGPPNGTLLQEATFTFTGIDNRTPTLALSFECALDSTTAWNSCTSPEDYSDLVRGSHTLRVRAVDAAGNADASPAEYTWIVAPPPIVTLTSGPGVDPTPEASTSTSATFEFASDVPGVTFHCWLDGEFNPSQPGNPAEPAPCISGQTYSDLGLGPHLFAVRAVDGFGNIGVWEDIEFTVLPPEARITSAPASGTSTSATFAFTSEPLDADAVYYCSLDGRPFGLCESPKSYTGLFPGEHTFRVQTVYDGLDWRGEPLEFEPVPASHTWSVIDLTPPETVIEFGPPATTISTSAYLGISSDDPTATIACTLNGVAEGCESGGIVELTDLLPGTYTFTAQATDPSGNVDASPASRSWTIESPVGPGNTPAGTNVVVSLPQPGGTANATVTFASVETAGFTALDRLAGGPPLPEGYGGASGSIYDISTTALFTEPVTVCLTYDPAQYATTAVRLLHFDGTAWVDITTLNNPFVSPARVCGLSEGFSLFAIAAASSGMMPETSILSGPDGPLNLDGIPTSTSGSATFEFWADQPNSITQCSIDGDPFFFCESPVTVGPLAAGDHEFIVQAINEFGWMDLTPAIFEWEVIGPDVTPPSTIITRGPTEGSSTPNFINVFEFSGTDDFSPVLELDYQCTLDGVNIGNCETPEEIEVLTPGAHSLRVQAIDEAGNIDPVGATRNWTVIDMSGPDTEIILGPESETTETSATFEFEGFELLDGTPVNQFECALDAGEFAACTSPYTVTGLANGPHVFHVRAVDPDGNKDISPEFYEWLITAPVDTTPPDTFIVASPNPANSGPDVTFAFASNEQVESFECSTGAGILPAAPTTWQECGPVLFLEGLASGQHWLWVRAIDAAGNVDPTPAPGAEPFVWITTGEPNTFITSGPADPTGAFSAEFVFGSDQAAATFQCSVDGSPWTPCTSSETEPYIAGPFLPEENGAPSEHTFEVRAVNQYRNADGEQVLDLSPATHEWRVQDTAPPSTVFLGATEIGPEQFLEPGLRFTFRGDDDWASSFELTFECALDNTADAAAPVWEDCGEPAANDSFFHEIAYADLTSGPYTFQVRAIDVAENVDQSPAPVPAYEFVVEAEPETTIASVVPDMGVDLQTDSTTVTFSFSGTGVSFECALDSVTFSPCSSPVTYTGVPYGTHLFRVQAVAVFGTRDLSPAEFAWDSGHLTAPDVAITSSPVVPTEATSATFTFESTDPDASFLCTLDGVGPLPCSSPQVYDGLLAGIQNPHSFEVVATKANLLVDGVPAIFDWTITDNTAPQTILLAPLPSSPSANAVEFRFTGTDNGTIPANLDFECSLDGALYAPCSSPLSLTELTGGEHTLLVRAIDEVPLTDLSPASHVWNVIAPPATQITAAPAALSTSAAATFEFFDQPGSTYECRLDPVEVPVPTPFEPCVSPKEYTGLTNGAHVFEVRATTLMLNGTSMVEAPPVEYAWTVNAPDAIAPNTSIDLALADAATTTSTSATFVFSGTDNLTAPAAITYECSLDGALFAGCQSGVEYLALGVGPHTFEVRAVDAEGNVDGSPASRSWTVAAGTINTPAGADVEVDLGGGASATFAQVTAAGVTSVNVLSGNPSLPAPFSAAGALFLDVSTTASFSGNVEVCLAYDSGLLDEPHLIHLDGGQWVDVTSSLDPVNGIVCGVVSSLSPFAVAEAPGLSPETSIVQVPVEPVLESVPGGAEVQFQFTSNDPLADFQCSLDGGDWNSCDTPHRFTAAIGQHTLRVRALSQGGAFDLTPSSHTWTVLERPAASIDSGPEDQAPADPDIQNESRSASFTFSSDQPLSTFECRLTGETSGTAWEPCTSPKAYENLLLEEYVFEVQAINAAGHASLIPAQFEWTVADLTPPNTTIHSGPADPTSATSATFVFSADEPATFQCLLDGLPSACSSGLTITNLGPGTHTFEVLATDLSEQQNVELAPAVRTWTVDTQAPGVTLLEKPPATDTATSASFTFSASDNHSSPASLDLECRLDGQPAGWESCASPKSYAGLLPGDHTFELRAIDEAGNVASASYGWEILDTIDPETEITAIEPGSIIFHFSGSDNHSPDEALTFQCKLDGAAFSACVSPKVYENAELSVGQHTFQVRAVDEAGNVDATPDTHTWTVLDVTPPETTITAQPESPTASTGASFSFTASDDASVGAGLAYECSLDGAAFAACASPKSYSGLAVGSHTFRVRAVDEAGNEDASPASYTWIVLDTTAPETTITAAPDAATAATGASFSFAGNDDATAASSLSFQCSLDGGAYGDCISPRAYSGLAIGAHTFHVRATDAAGNTDATPASYSWTIVDATAPETTITAQPAASTGSTSASFEFSGSDNVTAAASLRFECSLDGGAYADCISPKAYSGLAVGAHTFQVRATDAAGNTDASPASYAWTVLDTIAPDTNITAQPESPTPSTGASFSFGGSDDTTAAASLSYQCSLDAAAFADCVSPKVYSGLAAGAHTFRVRAVDAAGNVDASPASYAWTVLDTIAPETTITGQPVATTTNTNAAFSFTGSDDVTAPASLTYECALDGAALATCTSPKSYSGLAAGTHTFQVRATDAAGNVDASPASYTWEIQVETDTTAPETTITAQPPETTTETSASFSFLSSEIPSTFECSLDGATFAACTWPKAYSGLALGPHTFRVRAIDAALNVDATPASYAWTIAAPTVDCGPQQTLTASADAWIDQGSPSSNKGSDSILKVMSKSGSNLRALVRFNLPTMPQGCSVQSATLRIYTASGASGRTLRAYRLAGAWTEGAVTWQNQPATTGGAVTVSSGTGYRDWNVASEVQWMYSGANNGFLVRDANENQDAEQQLHSRENSSNRPLLVLQLGNGAPPPPPPGDVDTTGPDTSITGNPLSATTSTAATFTFSGLDDVTPAGSLTFQCQLDVPETSSWTACASPRSYSGLAQGSHTFRVRAVDAALNVDPSPAVYTWTIDQTAPETVISIGPGSTTTSTSASFQFTSPEQGAVFECSLDSAAFASCSSPQAYSGLAVGAHTFRVRAVDAAGNIDSSPASYPWTIQPGGGTVNCGPAQTMPAVADSWLEQSGASSNKGSDSVLKVMSKSGNANLRAVVRFNLPATPAGCVLDTATLRIYAGSASSSQRTLQAFRLNGAWTESGVTWANQPATTGSAVTTTSGTGYRQWGVAALVQAMYSSGSNNGFLIRDATEGQDAEQQFNAREKGENPPQLVVAFKPAP